MDSKIANNYNRNNTGELNSEPGAFLKLQRMKWNDPEGL